MASNRILSTRRLNTLTKKVPYRKIPKKIIVVGVPKEYLFIVYRGK